jgi:hypothetical protein
MKKECNTMIAWVMSKRVNGTNKDLIPTFRFKSGTCHSGTDAQREGVWLRPRLRDDFGSVE